MNVMPVVDLGRQPAKATLGEPFPVSATVFREGHDQLGAEVVLTDPEGRRRPPVRMVKHEDVPDRYDAWVTPDQEGPWAFEVHAWSDPLAMAAYLHSEDMAWNGFFSHTGSDGSSAGVRITRQGYPWTAYGENIAVGYTTVSSVIQGWLGSEGHCRNLMSPAFTEIGAGYAVGPFGGSPSARYWTLDLADR